MNKIFDNKYGADYKILDNDGNVIKCKGNGSHVYRINYDMVDITRIDAAMIQFLVVWKMSPR